MTYLYFCNEQHARRLNTSFNFMKVFEKKKIFICNNFPSKYDIKQSSSQIHCKVASAKQGRTGGMQSVQGSAVMITGFYPRSVNKSSSQYLLKWLWLEGSPVRLLCLEYDLVLLESPIIEVLFSSDFSGAKAGNSARQLTLSG